MPDNVSNMNAPNSRLPIGQLLIVQGIISEDQLRIALLEQMKSNQPVGRLLVALGFVSEATLRDALGESLGQKAVNLSNSLVDSVALKLVPRDLAKRHTLLPLAYSSEEQRLTIAISDTNDIVAIDKLRALFKHEVTIETLLAGQLGWATLPNSRCNSPDPSDQPRHRAPRPDHGDPDPDRHPAARSRWLVLF